MSFTERLHAYGHVVADAVDWKENDIRASEYLVELGRRALDTAVMMKELGITGLAGRAYLVDRRCHGIGSRRSRQSHNPVQAAAMARHCSIACALNRRNVWREIR